MPLLEYADIVWGDKNNSLLMGSLQILLNKTAKLVLDLPKFASSSQALHSLNWNSLKDRRRLHQWAFIFKVFNNSIDFNLKTTRRCSIHFYETRNRFKLSLPLCKTNWGKMGTPYMFINEWNNLPAEVTGVNSYVKFKHDFWKIKCNWSLYDLVWFR